MNKWTIKVTLTKHAEENLARLFGLSADFVIKDIRQWIYSLLKERGGYSYKIITHTAKYIVSIVDREVKVITILYKRNKKNNKKDEYLNRQYVNLGKENIRKLFN